VFQSVRVDDKQGLGGDAHRRDWFTAAPLPEVDNGLVQNAQPQPDYGECRGNGSAFHRMGLEPFPISHKSGQHQDCQKRVEHDQSDVKAYTQDPCTLSMSLQPASLQRQTPCSL
jgi:hypothetical protein